jgi:hypothetical protein
MDLMESPYQETGAPIERPWSFGFLHALFSHQITLGAGRRTAPCMNLMHPWHERCCVRTWPYEKV